jgi:hypothetical protein
MNSKGQSFAVFRLLIAAVIAVVILAVLMGIISEIITPGGKPIDTASRKIQEMRTSPYTPLIEQKVQFSREDSINARTLSEKSGGLLPDQICISTGPFEGQAIWEQGSRSDNELYSVRYVGTQTIEVALAGICGTRSGLVDDLEQEVYDSSSFKSEWFLDRCGCLNRDEELECCLLAVTR